MPQFNKRKRLLKEIAIEKERQRRVGGMQEEEGVSAIELLQRSADSVSDEFDGPEDDEAPVSEGEKKEEVDGSAFEKLITSALEQSGYVLFPEYLASGL